MQKVSELVSGQLSKINAGAISTKLPKESVRLLNSPINVKEYESLVIGNDWTNAFAQAMTDVGNGGRIVFPSKSTFTGKINITKSIEIDFQGSKIIPPNGTDNIIQAIGTKGANNYILTAPASRHDRSITLTVAPTDLAFGDLIVLRDDTVRSTDSAPDVNLEVHEVLSVSGATVYLTDFVRLPKTVSATANVYKIIPIKDIRIENIDLEAVIGATGNTGIFMDMVRKVRIRNINMTKGIGPAVTFYRSYDIIVNLPDLSAPQGTISGQGYGIQGYMGTNLLSVLNGKMSGMRHSVDCGNCFDVLVDNVVSLNPASSSFVMSHNGWDSDITLRNCRSYGGQSYAFEVSSNGVSNPYTIAHYGMKILACEAQIDTSSYTVGLYFQAPVKESLVDGLTLTYGKGDGVGQVGDAGIRMLSVDNDINIQNVWLNGFKYGVLQDSTTPYPNQVQAFDADRVKLQNIKIKNSAYPLYFAGCQNIDLENIDIDNVTTKALTIINNGTQKLRYLTLKDIALHQFVAGRLIDFTGTMPTSARLGTISNIHADTTSYSVNLNPLAGAVFTLEDILLQKNGEFIRIGADIAATLGASALPLGLVEGQKLQIFSGGAAITIPHGGTVANKGAVSVVLDRNTYIFSNPSWWQVN